MKIGTLRQISCFYIYICDNSLASSISFCYALQKYYEFFTFCCLDPLLTRLAGVINYRYVFMRHLQQLISPIAINVTIYNRKKTSVLSHC